MNYHLSLNLEKCCIYYSAKDPDSRQLLGGNMPLFYEMPCETRDQAVICDLSAQIERAVLNQIVQSKPPNVSFNVLSEIADQIQRKRECAHQVKLKHTTDFLLARYNIPENPPAEAITLDQNCLDLFAGSLPTKKLLPVYRYLENGML